VDNAEEEGNWCIVDVIEVEDFEGGRMYESRERILQFIAKATPIHSLPAIREPKFLQVTEREL